MRKQSLANIINELPKEFDLDQLMERLIVIEKIEKGLEDVKAGDTVPHEKVLKMVAKWPK